MADSPWKVVSQDDPTSAWKVVAPSGPVDASGNAVPLSGAINGPSDKGVPVPTGLQPPKPIPSVLDTLHPVSRVPVGQGPGLLGRIKDIPKTFEENMAPVDQSLAPIHTGDAVVGGNLPSSNPGMDTAAHNFGGAAARALLFPIMHPVDTLLAGTPLPQVAKEYGDLHDLFTGKTAQSDHDYFDPMQSLETTAGTGAGMLAGAGVAEAPEGINQTFPTIHKYGNNIQRIEDLARDAGVRVPLSETTQPLDRLMQLGEMNTIPQAVRSLSTNTAGAMEPSFQLPLKTARDYVSSISGLSADEAGKMAPVVKREMGGLRKGLHSDIADSLNTLQPPEGQNYLDSVSGMSNIYRTKEAAANAAKFFAKYVLPTGATIGVGDWLLHMMNNRH
jgi:hypothetical protein